MRQSPPASVHRTHLPGALYREIDPTWKTGVRPLHDQLASMINSAIVKDPQKEAKCDLLREKLLQDYSAEIIEFSAPDGALIEGMILPGTLSHATILFALGSGGRYESVADPDDAAHHFIQFFRQKLPRHSVMVINTRDIGHSKGPLSQVDGCVANFMQGCALDYYAAWSFLESRGLTVLPWGHSIGGLHVARAANWKQTENPQNPVSLVSDRSCDDLTNVMYQGSGGLILQVVGKALGFGGAVISDLQSLKGKVYILAAHEDPTIHYQTSSVARHFFDSSNNVEVVMLQGENDPHTRIYTEEEGVFLAERVESPLQQ